MSVNKKDIIKLLEKIALYMELKGENPFKISAFRKAAASLETDDRSLAEIDEFTALPGIGKGTAAVIEEYITQRSSTVLSELQAEVPSGLIDLLKLPGLGGKKISKLHKELGIVDLAGLEQACKDGKVREVAGFGKKSEEKILVALQDAGKRPERLPLAYMLPVAERIESQLNNFSGIERFSRAGSLRRMRETIKDLDYIIAVNDPEEVKHQLESLPDIKDVIASGETKVSLTFALDYDVNVDFRLVQPEEFPTALHHFTGSKDHNIRMRQLAKERGEKISEYGVENAETNEVITFASEQEFYQHFNLPFIPPELREDGTEVEEYHEKISLVTTDHIKGDLHMHSTWSDGGHSIAEMAEACRKRGYQYMAITDHSQFLRVANGLTPERVREQMEEVRKLNAKYEDFTILTGIEMDILPDGQLDFDDDLLSELDIVIASIHSSFSQSREKIMERLKNAMENPHVDIIAHPTGRLVGTRDGYDVDIERLIELAKDTNTALELNANPHRLDLCASHLKMAQDAGVKVVINTDAHQMEHLSFMEIGTATARKGWIRKNTVLNTMDLTQLYKFLHQRNN